MPSPFDESDAVHHLQLNSGDRVMKQRLVLLLLGGQVEDLLLAGGLVLDHESVDREVFPHDQRLDRAHLKCLKSVLDHEAVLARVLRDLIEVTLT